MHCNMREKWWWQDSNPRLIQRPLNALPLLRVPAVIGVTSRFSCIRTIAYWAPLMLPGFAGLEEVLPLPVVGRSSS